jgi:hypothetical protein
MHKAPVVGRPIVSSINSVTYHTSIYLQNKLFPIVKRISSICLSSHSVVKDLLKLEIPKGSVILCADVKNLYPSIPIDYGLHATHEMLHNFKLYSDEEIQLLVQLLSWVLTNNYFEFNNNVYRQISGTAMGTPVAVAYSNLTLAYLEDRFMHSNSLDIIYYRRYIDDIFAIIRNETDAKRLIDLFNKQCHSIQLDAVTIGTSGIFLDMNLELCDHDDDDNKHCSYISTTIYQKPSNKYLYIPPFSSHNKKLLINIIIQEIKRYRLYCSKENDFIRVLGLFKQRLYDRGYKPEMIDQYFTMKNIPTRDSLINNLIQHDNNKIKPNNLTTAKTPIIVVQLPNLRTPLNLKDTFAIPTELSNHERFKLAYDNTNIIIGKKNNRSLGKYLLHRPTISEISLHHSGGEIPLMEGTTAL